MRHISLYAKMVSKYPQSIIAYFYQVAGRMDVNAIKTPCQINVNMYATMYLQNIQAVVLG